MKYKVIFIDIDDTILDFEAYIKFAIKSGIEHFKLGTYKEEMLSIFKEENRKFWKRLEKGEITFQELKDTRFNIILNKMGFSFDGIKFEQYFRDQIYDFAVQVEDAEYMLSTLSKLAPIALASNGPFEQQIHRIKIANLDKYVSYYFISEQIGYSKPSKEFFYKAFEEINKKEKTLIAPSDCVMIGDSLSSDIKGGKNVNMTTIFFNREGKNSDWNIHPDYEFKTLKEITNFIKENHYSN